MRHYEVVFLVHPDQSEQVPSMVERYIAAIETTGGKIHRKEDWGRRLLAYPIQKIHKAHYILLNIECGLEALEELKSNFRYNDAVLRNMVIRCDEAVTGESLIMKGEREGNERDRKRDAEREARRVREESQRAAEASKPASKPEPKADEPEPTSDEPEVVAESSVVEEEIVAEASEPAEESVDSEET